MTEFRFSLRASLMILVALLAVTPGYAATAQPSVEQFKQAFEAQMQQLKPTGFTVRTILFEEVRPGKPSGGKHPFQVTATIHDYGPGYPPNHFYGSTCVGKIEKWKFDMRQDDFGGWIVEGRMTADSKCKDNPSEGVSAIPLVGLPGTPAGKAPSADVKTPPAPESRETGNLYVGEYACYGAGGRLMAGMGFHLTPGGKYHDLDTARGGTYLYNAGDSTISFKGGFLDGQVGRHVRNTGFALSQTVNCEPWR
jgi:hypothetical protein